MADSLAVLSEAPARARLHLGAAAHYWRTDWLRDGGAGRR
jgi:hypothetical protein